MHSCFLIQLKIPNYNQLSDHVSSWVVGWRAPRPIRFSQLSLQQTPKRWKIISTANCPPKQAASEFVKNLDSDLGFNPYELAGIAYEAPDPRGQKNLVKLLVAVRDLLYHQKEGYSSKREMDLRNDTDLNHVLFQFACTLADDRDSNLFFAHAFCLS